MEGLTAQEIMLIQQDLANKPEDERTAPNIIKINDKKACYECYFPNGQLFQFFYLNEKGEIDGNFFEFGVDGSLYVHKIFKNNKEVQNKLKSIN